MATYILAADSMDLSSFKMTWRIVLSTVPSFPKYGKYSSAVHYPQSCIECLEALAKNLDLDKVVDAFVRLYPNRRIVLV